MGSTGKGRIGDRLFPLLNIPGTNIDIDSWDGDSSRVVHHGVYCKGLQCSEKTDPIKGIRYKCSCSECPKIDFDDTCMRDPKNSHPREHKFWPCPEEVIFEDRKNMSEKELQELKESVGHIPEEYLVVTHQDAKVDTGAENLAATFNLDQLAAQLFGINNQLSDDQLLIHWKSGIPAARLIDLLPGYPDDDFQCYFTSTRLDEPEAYDALCCDWIPGEIQVHPGTAIQSELNLPGVIYIGEEYREIKKTTADALKALRSTDKVVRLWVEELCVPNQYLVPHHQYLEFKAFQERSTSLIHNRADRTIVWAGNEDEHTNAAFTLIEMLSHRCNCDDKILPSPSEIENDKELEQLDLLPIGSDNWQSLLKFLPPHLFHQGWMLHDVAFASKPIVRCGDYELEWWKVARVRDMLAQPLWMNLDWRHPTNDDSGFEDLIL